MRPAPAVHQRSIVSDITPLLDLFHVLRVYSPSLGNLGQEKNKKQGPTSNKIRRVRHASPPPVARR